MKLTQNDVLEIRNGLEQLRRGLEVEMHEPHYYSVGERIALHNERSEQLLNRIIKIESLRQKFMKLSEKLSENGEEE